MTVPAPTSPDCEVGKHQACTEQNAALDVLTDQIVDCTCPCHKPRGRR